MYNFTFTTTGYDVLGVLANKIGLHLKRPHYPRDRTAKLVEV